MWRVVTYLNVGWLLHLFCIFEIALLFEMYMCLHVGEWLQEGNIILKIILLLPFITLPFFPQLDAWSRYQNYKMLRDKYYRYGFQPRLTKPFIKSRCQRDAAFAAAVDLGFGKLCRQHFYEQGYRWYHILPDILLSNPAALFHKQFWQSTFFVKKYTRKIDDAMVREYIKDKAYEGQLAVHRSETTKRPQAETVF